jgi:hypothetical protein
MTDRRYQRPSVYALKIRSTPTGHGQLYGLFGETLYRTLLPERNFLVDATDFMLNYAHPAMGDYNPDMPRTSTCSRPETPARATSNSRS